MAETISSLVAVFESLGKEAEIQSTYHVREAVRKLPPSLKLAWARYEGDDPKRATLETFRSWLERQAKMWERAFVDPLQEKVNVKKNLPTEDPNTEPMHITRNKGRSTHWNNAECSNH